MANSERASRTSRPKRPNIYDVAKEARVSVFTVSAVINDKQHVRAPLRKRVDAAIQKLGYRPNSLAQSLAKEHTKIIGIIVPDISNPFFPEVVRGAEDTAQKDGYTVLLCNSDGLPEKEEEYLDLLIAKRVDGILLTKCPGEMSPRILRDLNDLRIPTVMMMRTYPKLSEHAVVTDDLQASYQAVSHLARVGHKTIALVGGPLSVSNGRERLQGFKKALKAYKLQYHPELVYEGDYRIDSGHNAGLSILPHRPDAVFVANFLMMVGFMQAAQELGMKPPDNFGLVALDDYPWLRLFNPPVTAVELPKYEVGKGATQLLLERIQGKAPKAATHKIMPQIYVRESCGFGLRTRSLALAVASPELAHPEVNALKPLRSSRIIHPASGLKSL